MGKIKMEFESKYDVGDVVIFEHHNLLKAGVVTSYYVEDYVIWYNITVGKDKAYSYCNGGDINENSIIGKVEDEEIIKRVMRIVSSDEPAD